MIIDNLFTRPIFESQMDPITQFASNAHEEWRRNFDPTGTKPRVKKNSDGTEGDINVPFEKLHPDWKKENLAAAHAAHHAVKHFGRDMEKAAEHVHNEWMKRNPKGDWNAAQHVPYDDLPEDEKEKDRVHVRTMMRLMGHHPEQGVAEGLSKRDQKDVAAIKAAIERLQAQLKQPNADKAAIQQSIAHEQKRLALYKEGVAEGSAANDYFTRRKSEEERIAGTRAPAKNKKNPANTDYAKRRKQQDVEEARQDARNYKVIFVEPDGVAQDLGNVNSLADATKLIKNKFYDIFDTGDRLRKVAPHIFALETDYTNTGVRVTPDNYKYFYHWIVQPEQGMAEDTTSDLLNMRRDDPRIQQIPDINALTKSIYDQMVAERGQPMDSRQQTNWMTIARTKAAAKISNPAAQNESQGMSEGHRPFRGTGGRFNRGDDERHDLDPTDWYKKIGTKMYTASIYPRQVAQAQREGWHPTKEQARANASPEGVAEGEYNPDTFVGKKGTYKGYGITQEGRSQ